MNKRKRFTAFDVRKISHPTSAVHCNLLGNRCSRWTENHFNLLCSLVFVTKVPSAFLSFPLPHHFLSLYFCHCAKQLFLLDCPHLILLTLYLTCFFGFLTEFLNFSLQTHSCKMLKGNLQEKKEFGAVMEEV